MTHFFDEKSCNYELIIIDSNREIFLLGEDGKIKPSQ